MPVWPPPLPGVTALPPPPLLRHHCQVDAKHVELHLDEQKPEGVVNEALEQIAYADRVVLNKTDLVAEGDLARLEERIRGINSMAEVR